MKQTIFSLIVAAGLLSGCAGVYKSGQTPDDLYYSPVKEVVVKEKKNVDEVSNKQQLEYQEYVSSSEDRYLRMKVKNNSYWNSLDDYSYWNDSRYGYYNSYYNPYGYGAYGSSYSGFGFRYGLGFGYSYGYGYDPYYFGWNQFYNPYLNFYGGGWYNPIYIVGSYKNADIAKRNTAGSNIYAFQNKTYNNINSSSGNYFTPGTMAHTSTNSFGTLVRTVFSGPSSSYTNNNSNNNTWSNPVRVQSSSTPTSSSAGGGSGGYSSSGSSTSSGRGPRN